MRHFTLKKNCQTDRPKGAEGGQNGHWSGERRLKNFSVWKVNKGFLIVEASWENSENKGVRGGGPKKNWGNRGGSRPKDEQVPPTGAQRGAMRKRVSADRGGEREKIGKNEEARALGKNGSGRGEESKAEC